MTKQLPLVNPPLAYQGSSAGFEGYRRGFDWGKNHQRDADQQIYDTDIAELNKEIERLTKELAEEKGYTKELTFFNKLNQDAALASKEGEETK
jgi:hypothetical protein